MRSVAINVFYTISLNGLGALWFLPTFFIALILAFVIWKWCLMSDRRTLRLCLTIFATVLIGSFLSFFTLHLHFWNDKGAEGYTLLRRLAWWYLSLGSRSIVCSSLCLIGRLMYTMKEKWFAKLKPNRMTKITWGYWLLSIIFLVVGGMLGLMQSNVVDLHFSFIYNPILFYLSPTCTVSGLMIIGTQVNIGVINFLGQNSLVVMAGQIIQQFSCKVVNKVFEMQGVDSSGAYIIASILTVLFVLLCSSIAAWIINNNKYANLLIKPRIAK